jgi:hypothetical protein
MDTPRPTRTFLFFPFYGYEQGERLRQDLLFWPLFGFGHDEVNETSFESAPWPIYVRKSTPDRKRHRIWPFYGRYDSEELSSRFYAWPLVWTREERTPSYTAKSFLFLPFFRKRTATSRETEESRTELHVWPLYSQEPAPEGMEHVAIPSLNPFQEYDIIDRLYDPVWTVYRRVSSEERGSIDFLFGAFRHRWAPESEHFSMPWLFWAGRDGEHWVRSLLMGLIRVEGDATRGRLTVAGIELSRFRRGPSDR